MDKEESYEIIHRVFGTRPYWTPMPFNLRKYRDRFPELFKELGFTEGAELGVFNGAFSVALCEGNPKLHLYGIDFWSEYNRRTQETQDTRYEKCCERLSHYNVTLIREATFDAVRHFEAGQLDFIYIDAGHTFDECILDLVLWSKVVRDGGIIALHDYHLTGDVGTAVEAYVRAHKVEHWFKTAERYPSVFWIHERRENEAINSYLSSRRVGDVA